MTMNLRVCSYYSLCVCVLCPFFFFKCHTRSISKNLFCVTLALCVCVCCCYHDYIKIVYYKLGRSYGQTVMTIAIKKNRILCVEEWNRRNSLIHVRLSVHVFFFTFTIYIIMIWGPLTNPGHNHRVPMIST